MKNSSLVFALLLLLLSACGSQTVTVDDGSDVLKVQRYNQVMQTGKDLIDPAHGKQVRFAYGAIAGAGETKANGVSYLHTFADGNSTLTVNVNILPAPAGAKYTAKISDGAENAIDIGELPSILGDARHSLQLTTNADVKPYTKVHVFLGTKLVAEGTLKEVAKP